MMGLFGSEDREIPTELKEFCSEIPRLNLKLSDSNNCSNCTISNGMAPYSRLSVNRIPVEFQLKKRRKEGAPFEELEKGVDDWKLSHSKLNIVSNETSIIMMHFTSAFKICWRLFRHIYSSSKDTDILFAFNNCLMAYMCLQPNSKHEALCLIRP